MTDHRRARKTSGFISACAAIAVLLSSVVATSAVASTRDGAQVEGVACVPTVEGPIPATASSRPFVAVFQPALPSGWVDEEFFVSCSSPDLTYKTAVFVRRPANVGRASGVVAVDPLHSLGLWGMQALVGPYFLSQDVVQVGVVTSNDAAENVLKAPNPARYSSLSVPATPDAGNDILAGVGALLHQRDGSLLAGTRVKSVILGGWSQTAVVTRTFISSPQAEATVGGQPVFDGFFPGQAAVGSSGRSQVQPVPDVGLPVLELQGERELLVTISVYGNLGYRRSDSKTYRLYEVPAMSHINNEPDSPVSGFAGSLTCDQPAGAQASAFRQTDIWQMAFENLVRWVSKDIAPPRAPRIKLEADGTTVTRDTNRNARGGLRSVFVDVPTASIMPTSLAPGGVVANPCAYVGYQLDFDEAALEELYRTHAGYVQAVVKSTKKLEREGFLLSQDARELVTAARQSNILQ
jgi:hypothetical protein